MKLFKMILICFAVFTTKCAAEGIASAPTISSEQDEYVQAFIQTLKQRNPEAAKLVSYKDGQLTIKSIPWNPTWFKVGTVFSFLGLGATPLSLSILGTCRDESAASLASGMLALSFLSFIIGSIVAGANGPSEECNLTLDDDGLSLNGTRYLTWNQINDLVVETITLGYPNRTTAQDTTLKIFDQFKNQLLHLSTKDPLGVSLNNVVALIKHYQEKATQKPVTISKNKTNIIQENPQIIYVPTR